MTLTVRLDPELERRLEAASKRRHKTKSAVVTDLVREFVARERHASAYEIAVRLGVAGCDRTGPADVAANAKKYARRVIGAKHRQ
jgi:predicted transcriptional regulator